MDDEICVKRLQDIPRHKTVVNAGVLILLKLGQLILPYVDHFVRAFQTREKCRRRECDG